MTFQSQHSIASKRDSTEERVLTEQGVFVLDKVHRFNAVGHHAHASMTCPVFTGS